jgi:hypothetical protein
MKGLDVLKGVRIVEQGTPIRAPLRDDAGRPGADVIKVEARMAIPTAPTVAATTAPLPCLTATSAASPST